MIAMSSTRSERRHRTMVPAPALLLLLLLASPLASAQPAGAKNVLYLVRVQFFFRQQRKKPGRLLVSVSIVAACWALAAARLLLLTAAYRLPPLSPLPEQVVDDLRPVMNVAYKQDYMVTPAFDKLANESLVFSRAFCQIAVCAPSRSSFMSGVRPDATGIFNFANNIRDPGQPRIITLPEQFRTYNYTVLGVSAIAISQTQHWSTYNPFCFG